MPGIPAVSFEADQRVITGTAVFLGIVANPGPLNPPAKEWQNRRIQIEDQAAWGSGKDKHLPAQEIVNPDDTFQLRVTQFLQKFPQGGRFGKALQPQQTLETAVVMKNARIRNSSHTSYHSVNYRQNQFDWMVETASAIPGNIALQKTFQIQFSTKLLKKNHPSKVCQARILEGNADFSYPFWHFAQTVLKVRFLQQIFDHDDYNLFSSIMSTFLVVKYSDSPFFQDEETPGGFLAL